MDNAEYAGYAGVLIQKQVEECCLTSLARSRIVQETNCWTTKTKREGLPGRQVLMILLQQNKKGESRG